MSVLPGRIAGAIAALCIAPTLLASLGLASAFAAGEQKPSGPVVVWHPGAGATELRAASTVRVTTGFHRADLALLRDDQMVQTPSGRTVRVSTLRSIMGAASAGQARVQAHRLAPAFAILPNPTGGCERLATGAGLTQILARPDSQVVCFASGRRTTVGQIRAMSAYALKTRGGAPTVQSGVHVRTVQITSRTDLKAQIGGALRREPDTTVLVNPGGHRVTIAQLRKVLGGYSQQHALPASPHAAGAR